MSCHCSLPFVGLMTQPPVPKHPMSNWETPNRIVSRSTDVVVYRRNAFTYVAFVNLSDNLRAFETFRCTAGLFYDLIRCFDSSTLIAM